MSHPRTILIVDDDAAVRKLLGYALEQDGHKVIHCRDGAEALPLFLAEPIDLVILDIALPGLDGLEVCRQLRARSGVPIIMLTARDEELDIVVGLELGADDYVIKPFSIREFRARVRALLRRARGPRHDTDDSTHGRISIEQLSIDLPRRIVELQGRTIALTHVEFELLATLARHPGRVYSRRALLESLWGNADFRDPRTIDVHIRHLRQKLEQDSSNPNYILTVRSVGYRLRET